MTDDQLTEFVALVKANATKVSLEIRDVGYAVEAAGHRVAQALYFLAVIVAVSVVALIATMYGLRGGT